MTTTRRFALGALAASIMLAGHTAHAEITDNEIRIGYLADMSGPYRDPIGPMGQDAIQMAIDDVGGSVAGANVVGKARHPFPSSDFSSFLLQAQASGADVVALNNAGSDTINAITTAGEFGITQAGQVLAGMVLFSTDVRSIGLEAAQGLQFTKAWYYDLNDETRAWAERFRERTGNMPTMVHAGLYSSTLHYLQAVDAIGTDEAQAVRQQMAATPINDIFATGGYIREDGRMVHDMYLVEVKTPEESQNEDDLFRVVRTIPAEEAFRPLSESQCRLVNGA